MKFASPIPLAPDPAGIAWCPRAVPVPPERGQHSRRIAGLWHIRQQQRRVQYWMWFCIQNSRHVARRAHLGPDRAS